jgi:transposase
LLGELVIKEVPPMHITLLLPVIAELQLLGVDFENARFLVEAKTTSQVVGCPRCQQQTERVHSYYWRKITDLPWAGFPVLLKLQVRRFFCRNEDCIQRVFCERLTPEVAAYARRTRRQQQHLQMLAVAMGGELTARLLPKLGLSGSPSMLLRLVRSIDAPSSHQLRVIGVDDWAKRKGHNYGTILVDLEQSQIVDLLEDRTPESVAAWLTTHPEVEVISRDRFINYAQAAAQAAPAAVQVVDRFHLLRNLTDALQRILDGLPAVLHKAALLAQQQQETVLSLNDAANRTSTAESIVARQTRQDVITATAQPPAHTRAAALFQQVKILHQQGLSQRAIARETGLHRRTVRRYFVHNDVPVRALSPQSTSTVKPYFAYLQRRRKEGCDNFARLHAELAALGYQGSYASVRRAVLSLPAAVDSDQQTTIHAVPVRPISSRRAAWLLVRIGDKLNSEENQMRDALCSASAVIATAHELAQGFFRIVRQRCPHQLDAWLAAVHASGIAQLRNFAEGIVRDYSAVKAALTLNWSNGPVEGHVNKLKLLKRQMYGRAKLDLLQQRLIHAL